MSKDSILKQKSMAFAKKEAAETLYWLDLLYSCDYIPVELYSSVCEDCRELLLMLTASIKSTVE